MGYLWVSGVQFFGSMADTKEAEAEITLETYDKHHVKVPKSIATRSAIINMMIEGDPTKLQSAAYGRLVNQLMSNAYSRACRKHRSPFSRHCSRCVSSQIRGTPMRSYRLRTRAVH